MNNDNKRDIRISLAIDRETYDILSAISEKTRIAKATLIYSYIYTHPAFIKEKENIK